MKYYRSKVIKWGNSRAISLPKNISEMMNLKLGDVLDLEIGDSGELILSKVDESNVLEDPYFGAADIVPKKSGLNLHIRSCHGGVRHLSSPELKIENDNTEEYVSIESKPKLLKSNNYTNDIRLALFYIGKNYDLFLKHFSDTDDSFIDDDLFNALRDRGVYK